ncbi:hypothetical protein Tco_0951503 [Tanacetum coccineum]|uniref:Reverse transcriptase Ty1/copia-type domain-containing protein n=1 Tax=Tanacetum coccineum TaxID=301880 RepID=A0ABQ5DV31_9ASTR
MIGKILFFLGLQISQSPRGIFINQSKYALESLKKYGFDSCNPVDTPMVEKSKLDEDKEGKAVDPSHYRGIIGTLLYLTASRPDLQFSICMCARYQARPTEKHLHAVKRIFQYVRGTVNWGLCSSSSRRIDLLAGHSKRLKSGADYCLMMKLDPGKRTEDKRKEEPIPKQLLFLLLGLSSMDWWAEPPNNNMGIDQEAMKMNLVGSEEEVVEEEMEDEEDKEMEVEDNDGKNDDAEVYNPYEEADPLNRPPPSPKTAEREIMNTLVTRNTLQPIPPIRQFSSTFYVGEGSFATVFNPALCKVYPLGPMVNDPNALYSRVKTLTKQMWDRFRVESSSSRRLERNDMRMDSFDYDLTALDSTFREQMQEMKKEPPYDPSTNLTSRPRCIDSYVMVKDNAVRTDAVGDHGGESVDTTAIVKDVGEEKNDEGDVAAAKDSQPSESRGSLRDP